MKVVVNEAVVVKPPKTYDIVGLKEEQFKMLRHIVGKNWTVSDAVYGTSPTYPARTLSSFLVDLYHALEMCELSK